MPLSPFKRGYAFQHTIKDQFLELGFIAQEEHPATRTDICLSHPPFEIAVECKHVQEGVTLEHVNRFDERLKQWQDMGRPCLGVMVATHFQADAQTLCNEKNVLCITQQQINDALTRKRTNELQQVIPVSDKLIDFLRSLSGLLNHWIAHMFGDPVDEASFFLETLLEEGYASRGKQFSDTKLELHYSEKGKHFFDHCKSIFHLTLEIQNSYSNVEQITRCTEAVLADWQETDYGIYDKMILFGLGVLQLGEAGVEKSAFADELLQVISRPQ